MPLTPTGFDAIRAIIAQVDNCDDLARISDHIKARWDAIQRETTRNFRVGDRVTFTPPRRPRVEGRVEAVNPKNIKVRTDTGIWNVSSNLLTKI